MRKTPFPLTLLLVASACLGLAACDSSEECVVPRDGTLLSEDTEIGDGLAVVSEADSVFIYYVGTLENGTIFDQFTTQNSPDPVGFLLGQLIEGWKQGLIGMREGGRRKLTVPPSLGYGCASLTSIPENSTLIFDIVLERVVRGGS